MCGRFALDATEAALKAHFNLTSGLVLQPRYNIPPSTPIPILKSFHEGVDFASWGFIPSWYKTLPEKQKQGYINARIETLAEKPAFKTDFRKHRCLIPATGYFEWRKFGEKKQPYFIYLKDAPLFAFAGIWSSWDTCAILTMEAPEFFQRLHNRMPVIIAPKFYEAWLSQGSRTKPHQCLLPMEEKNLGVHAVTPRMNNPRYDEALCIQPL